MTQLESWTTGCPYDSAASSNIEFGQSSYTVMGFKMGMSILVVLLAMNYYALKHQQRPQLSKHIQYLFS